MYFLGSCQQKLTFLADMFAKAWGKTLSVKKMQFFFCGGKKNSEISRFKN